MKNFLSTALLALLALQISTTAFSQSNGTLTFTFTQLPHTSYTASKNVMAVWIQSSNGTFIETRTRNVGNGTKDHLPTWATNSGGSSFNALASNCNVVNATTGATYTSFTTRTVTWDGMDANGLLVPDGTYKITIESTWNHGSSGTVLRSFTFTKGPTDDLQTPATDANFSNISLNWVASQVGLDEVAASATGAKVYPNPSETGIFNVDYTSANEISVYDMLGNQVAFQQVVGENGTATLDLTDLSNGIYFLRVSDGIETSEHKIVVRK